MQRAAPSTFPEPSAVSRSSYIFTSESVSEGHPDKVADRISDTVVDAFLAAEPEARVACETLVTTNRIVLAGEVRAGRPGGSKAESKALTRDIIKSLEPPDRGDQEKYRMQSLIQAVVATSAFQMK